MKKVLSILLSVVLIFSTLTFVSIPAGAETDGYLTYEVSNGEATITDCDESVAGDIIIPSTLGGYPVTSIGSWAFFGCSSLTSVTIPDSVTSISNNAFTYCSSLTSVTIGDSVTSIGEDVFYSCFDLTSITVDNNNPNYSSIDGVLFNKEKTELIQYPIGKTTTDYTIPDGVTSIGNNAFEDSMNLISITIPYGVTSIGDMAFLLCMNLENITIPDSVTHMGHTMFNSCQKLKTVRFPNELTTIERTMFSDCPSLESVIIGKKVTTIEEDAFNHSFESLDIYYKGSEDDWNAIEIGADNYGSLDIATIHYNYTEDSDYNYLTYTVSNGEATITDCDKSVSGNITLPKTLGGYPVTRIGSGAFEDCTSLTSVTIPDSVTSIGDRAFDFCLSLTSITVDVNNSNYSSADGVLFNKDKTELIQYPIGKTTTSYTIPDGVTSIDSSAFSLCSSLTSVTIPNSVTSIGDSAFNKCRNLTSVTIPNSVTSIGAFAFAGCSRELKSITIPDSVTSIGDYAFYACGSLTSITVENGNQNYCSVDGVLFNKNKTEIIQYPDGKTSTSYTIPDSVTSIGEHAFSSSYLTRVTIPNSVTSIGDSAFSSCYSLTSVTIPDSVTSIGDWVFSYCNSLTRITIPDSVTSIGDVAFYSCDSLTRVTIPNSVISIGSSAFGYCDSLTNVTIPNSVTSIGDSAFSSCDSLSDIYIMNNDCYIYGSKYTFPDNATIYGYTGSTAQEYATEYNRKFVALDKTITTEQTASIRLDTEVQGIRFYTQIDTEGLDIAEIGTLIGPTDLIGEELTLDTEKQGNAIKVVFDLSKGLYDNKYVVGTIAGIKEKNYARDFTARAYIILTNGVIIYSDTTSTRNIAQIADAYIADANSGYSELAPDLKSKVDEWAAANDIKPEPTTKHDPYVSDTW